MSKLNFLEFDIRGSKDYYDINPSKITWLNVTRNTPIFLIKKFDEGYFDNFTHKFSFTIKSIKNYSDINRQLFTLWKIRKKPGTIVSAYISEIQNTDNEYNIVFFQRQDRNNVFVHHTNRRLMVGKKYNIYLNKKARFFKMLIYDEDNPSETYIDSGKLEGLDENYNELIICQGFAYDVDPKDEITGFMEDAEFLEEMLIEEPLVEIKKEESEYDVFIAYYLTSGGDFAKHLWDGLKENNLNPFYDKGNIANSEEWEKVRDNALINCKIFILLMTPGFEIRPQIKHEVKLAMEHNAQKLYCKDEKLSGEHLRMKLDDKTVLDFNKSQYFTFENCEQLFREVYYRLDEKGWFPPEVEPESEE